jgi:hypothetical protein
MSLYVPGILLSSRRRIDGSSNIDSHRGPCEDHEDGYIKVRSNLDLDSSPPLPNKMTDIEVAHPDEFEAVPASQEKIDPRDQNYYLESITFKVGSPSQFTSPRPSSQNT